MIEAGDVVYHCVKWVPGKETVTVLGKGTVTLIVDDVISGEKRARMIWEDGMVVWLPVEQLVKEQNLIKNNKY